MITIVNCRVELGSSSVYLNRTRVCYFELLFPMQTCWFLAVKGSFQLYSVSLFFGDFLSYSSSPCSSYIWFSCIQYFTVILLWVYNQFNDLFLVDLLAQLVESYTGIAEVKGLNPVKALIISLPFHNYKSCTYNCDDLLWYTNYVMIEHLEILSFLSSTGSWYWIGKKNSCSSQKSSSSKK